MNEPGAKQKTTARAGLAFLLVFLCSALSLRLLYAQHRQQFIDVYVQQQSELAMRAAGESDNVLREILRAIKTLAASGLLEKPGGGNNTETLKTFMESLGDLGVLDLAILGGNGLPVSASGYVSDTGMSTEELKNFLSGIGFRERTDALISEIIQIDAAEGEPGYVIMVAVPVMLNPLPPQAAPEKNKKTKSGDDLDAPPQLVEGLLVAPVSVKDINRRIQKVTAGSRDRQVFALDRNGFFVSHISPEFVGAQSADALNLPKYPRLQKIVDEMKKGNSGTGWFYSRDKDAGNKDVKWHAAFAPTRLGEIYVAAVFQQSDTPFLGALFLRYLIINLIFLVVTLVAAMFFVREKRRYIDLENSATRLGDTSAVNEMLTTINSDMTEEKKQLEQRLEELRSINKEREARIRNLVELEEHLSGSVRRPSRTQRNLMNEMQRELKLLLKPPENRFRRRQKDLPNIPLQDERHPELDEPDETGTSEDISDVSTTEDDQE